jgi:sensor histidine kinase regulating citrate/malate metabolism
VSAFENYQCYQYKNMQMNNDNLPVRPTSLRVIISGAGLGLYIIRTMIENSGGKVEESKGGEGATFNVYFSLVAID